MGVNHKLIYGVNDFETWCKENNRLDILEEWDVEKNNGLMPKDVFKSSKIKYFWKCKEGHSYECNTSNRQQWACPICSHNKLLKGFNDFETWCMENSMEYLLKEWDYTKNEKLPCDYFPFTQTKVWWKGECGHSYEMRIAKRSVGKMCPICGKAFKTSFPEQSIYYYVSKKYKDTVNSFIINGKEIDIYIPSLRIGIEYDGYKWHQDINRDIEKNKLCEENGIILYRIREKNLPIFEETDFLKIVYCDTECSEENKVEIAVQELIKRLNIDVVVSLKTDRISIYSSYMSRMKEQSFAIEHPELLYLWNYDKNGDFTPYMVSSGSKKVVWWKDSCGHSWDTTVKQIVSGQRCPYCAGARMETGINDLETMCPDLVKKEWDFDKNSIKPNEIYYQSMKKVWWKCSKGHSYEARIDNRIKSNTGCPYCGHRKLAEGETDLLAVRPEVKKYWDYDKNIKEPNEVFSTTIDKYWFKCDKGHSFLMSVASWNQSENSCPICNGKQVLEGFNDFESHYPQFSKYWDNEKNNVKPNEVLSGSGKKYWFKCDKGHSFEYSLANVRVVKNEFCPYCGNRKLLVGFNDLATVRPDLIDDWDFNKNELKPDEIKVNSTEKVHWKCKDCGTEWDTAVNLRTGKSNTGCPKCCYVNNKERSEKLRKISSKKIINLDTGVVYNSGREAEEKTGISADNISKAVNGKSKTAGGYRWAVYKE